jgi:hypothetical protein
MNPVGSAAYMCHSARRHEKFRVWSLWTGLAIHECNYITYEDHVVLQRIAAEMLSGGEGIGLCSREPFPAKSWSVLQLVEPSFSFQESKVEESICTQLTSFLVLFTHDVFIHCCLWSPRGSSNRKYLNEEEVMAYMIAKLQAFQCSFQYESRLISNKNSCDSKIRLGWIFHKNPGLFSLAVPTTDFTVNSADHLNLLNNIIFFIIPCCTQHPWHGHEFKH